MTQGNHIKLCKPFILLVIYFICSFSAFGQKNQEVINLEADEVNYDYKKGIVHYQGNVHATQGETDLTADQMIVYYNENHKIKQIVAIGQLAHYQTLLKEKKDVLKASARTISYYPIAGKVILQKQASIEYNANLFSGPFIYYDMINKVISSHPKKKSQSQIVLEPFKQLKFK